MSKPASTKDIFDQYLNNETLFLNREVMRSSYIPDNLPHRTKEIDSLANILTPALKGEAPSNVFIYGKTGTGKTAVVKHLGKELRKKGDQLGTNINFIYLNCAIIDTHYRLLQNIANQFMSEWNDHVPFTGWPTDEVYTKLKTMIDKEKSVIIIVLDEVDKLQGDDALYNLTRINTELQNARISIIGISNDLKFTELLDPRVRSSLGEESMIFSPYDATQLKDILDDRAKTALKKDATDDDVIPFCAALSAQEHGDARRALDLLRVATELAERNRAPRVTRNNVKQAQEKIELDRITEVVRTLPNQSKLVLYAILLLDKQNKKAGTNQALTTGQVYDLYHELCKKIRYNCLTQRRTTDLIAELDMLGVVTSRVISKGRHGRTTEIQIASTNKDLQEVLNEDDVFKELSTYKMKEQSRLTIEQSK